MGNDKNESPREINQLLDWQKTPSGKQGKCFRGQNLVQSTFESEYSNTFTEELDLCKKELENTIQWRTQGAILRCKARWNNDGEKSTKYFLNVVKRHC